MTSGTRFSEGISSSSSTPAIQSTSGRKHRKINRSLPQLKRNAACAPCRRRRVKCDGAKPACGSCIKSYHFLARTQPNEERDVLGIQCTYEDGGSDEDDGDTHFDEMIGTPPARYRGEKRKVEHGEEDPSATIRRLEAQIAELQTALAAADLSSQSAPAQLPTAISAALPHSVSSYPTVALPLPKPPCPDPALPKYDYYDLRLASPAAVCPHAQHQLSPTVEAIPAETPQSETTSNMLDAEAGQIGGPFVDLFWPGWPKRLPTPYVMDHIVHSFFTLVPSINRIIHKQTFMARLALPPTHPNFPHVALLHAICAVSGRYLASVYTCPVEEIMEESRRPTATYSPSRPIDEQVVDEKCFSERHWKYMLLEVQYDNVPGPKLLEQLQAQVLINQYGCQRARWMSGWVNAGTMTRTAIALGLFDDRGSRSDTGGHIQTYVLAPPANDVEREERRFLACELVRIQAEYSSSGTWLSTLMLDEIYITLPAQRHDFQQNAGNIVENPQNTHSQDLFTRHPVADAWTMSVKAAILLWRITNFTRSLRIMRPEDKPRARQMPELQTLNEAVINLRSTFPANLRDPLQSSPGYVNKIDPDLVDAHLIGGACGMYLYEPFADVSDPDCQFAKKILADARACLSIVYLMINSSADMTITLLPAATSEPARVWFYNAGRIITLFYHHALSIGDVQRAEVLLNEIEALQMALTIFGTRYPLGSIFCGMLDAIVDKIHEEFQLPRQAWKFMPSDWSTATGPSGALNYRAGMRAGGRLPTLPQTHPDALAWNDDKSKRMSARQIFDQRRSFVGRSPSASVKTISPEGAAAQHSSDAGIGFVPTLASVYPADENTLLDSHGRKQAQWI